MNDLTRRHLLAKALDLHRQVVALKRALAERPVSTGNKALDARLNDPAVRAIKAAMVEPFDLRQRFGDRLP
jgi:hypothetical protein